MQQDMDKIIAETSPANRRKYLIFTIDGTRYGLEISHVLEIIGLQDITALPRQPAWVKGVINLRGSIIPVMDAGVLFGKPEKVYDERTCIIVMSGREKTTGMIVDRVLEVLSLGDGDFSRNGMPGQPGSDSFMEGIARMDGQVVLVLDGNNIVDRIGS